MEEGRSKTGYLDPAGIPSKCYGDTSNVVVGRPYSDAECRASLETALIKHCGPVAQSVPGFRSKQYALTAGCSLGYNAGVGGWLQTDARQHMLHNEWPQACRAFMWSDTGKRIYITARNRHTGIYEYLPGLDKRRQIERLLCDHDVRGDDGWQPGGAALAEYNKLIAEVAADLAGVEKDYDLEDVK
jgi:lysozyme